MVNGAVAAAVIAAVLGFTVVSAVFARRARTWPMWAAVMVGLILLVVSVVLLFAGPPASWISTGLPLGIVIGVLGRRRGSVRP